MAMQPPFFGKREPDVLQGRTVPGSAHLQPTQAASVTPGATVASTAGAASGVVEGGSKLTVGPNIKLKGVEITDCDTLVVEGLVEATMDSRLMQIAEKGAFKGAAEIDLAEIRGRFDGELTVREKLVIHATGRVHGTIRYGRLIVEDGGQLSGQIECSLGAAPSISRPAAIESLAAPARSVAVVTAPA